MSASTRYKHHDPRELRCFGRIIRPGWFSGESSVALFIFSSSFLIHSGSHILGGQLHMHRIVVCSCLIISTRDELSICTQRLPKIEVSNDTRYSLSLYSWALLDQPSVPLLVGRPSIILNGSIPMLPPTVLSVAFLLLYKY